MLPCGIEPIGKSYFNFKAFVNEFNIFDEESVHMLTFIGVFICTEESSPADGIFLLKQLPPPQQVLCVPPLLCVKFYTKFRNLISYVDCGSGKAEFTNPFYLFFRKNL